MNMEQKKKNRLNKNLEDSISAFVDELCSMWNIPRSEFFFPGDDITDDVVINGEMVLSLTELVYAVNNGVSVDEAYEWWWYAVDAHTAGLTTPNLMAWHKGCPRVEKSLLKEISDIDFHRMALIDEAKKQISETR